MAERAITLPPKTFAELTAQVRTALISGQRHVDRAYLETYRTTGRLIDAHLLLYKERAGYGEKVIPRLARELEVNERLLYRCLRFVREYPILTGRSELSWAHYRLLIEVADRAQRKTLEADASRLRWNCDELERRVRAINAINVTPGATANGGGTSLAPAHAPLVPRRGVPGVYRVAKIDGVLAVDLGFACYLDLGEEGGGFAADQLVRVDGNGRIAPAAGASKADLFNYRVEIGKVVDGDTFWVKIYQRPRQWTKQKLRLRGLDCPELSTAEGNAAKRFVDALVAKASAITINTTKPDKYDRYLADVFLTPEQGESPEATGEPLYLNHALLEGGHAVRKDAWEFADWEPGLIK